MAPSLRLNLDIREAVDFVPTATVQTGWQWQSDRSGRRFRVGAQYFNGNSSQFSFFRDKQETIGLGVWFDY